MRSNFQEMTKQQSVKCYKYGKRGAYAYKHPSIRIRAKKGQANFKFIWNDSKEEDKDEISQLDLMTLGNEVYYLPSHSISYDSINENDEYERMLLKMHDWLNDAHATNKMSLKNKFLIDFSTKLVKNL